MYTYQIQNLGVVCHTQEEVDALNQLNYPIEANITLNWSPKSPFDGCSNDGMSFGKEPGGINIHQNKTTGKFSVSSSNRFDPVDVEFQAGQDITLRFQGSDLIITKIVQSLDEVVQIFAFFAHEFSSLLSIYISDTPIVVGAIATLGESSFVLGLNFVSEQAVSNMVLTTNQGQESLIVDAFQKAVWLLTEGEPQRRRLSAAMTFFQRACRLNLLAQRKGEFASEEILNYAKMLEVLFPTKDKNEGTMDAARRELEKLGFSTLQRESLYVPMILLRNQLDSGHPLLSIPSVEQKNILSQYLDKAASAFRLLLHRIFQKIEAKEYCVPIGTGSKLTKKSSKPIERLASNLAEMNWDEWHKVVGECPYGYVQDMPNSGLE
ncbi:MAG: hypothetical protein WA954_09290 [Parerythrobacter sp.]